MLHIVSMMVIDQPGNFDVEMIDSRTASKLVNENEWQSHITFQNSRDVLQQITGKRFPMPRAKHDRLMRLSPGDMVLLCKPKRGYRPAASDSLRPQDVDLYLIAFEL